MTSPGSHDWSQRQITVLGATAGLAQQALEDWANAGASILLQGRNAGTLHPLQSKLEALGGKVRYVVGALQDKHLLPKLLDEAEALPGTPSAFVCFIGTPGRFSADEWNVENFSALFGTNCAGPILACRGWVEWMKAKGHSGNAVLFSTMQAMYPFEGSLPYALSKAALTQGVELLAKESGGAPVIRVNALAPGVHEAGMALASIQRGKYQPYLKQDIIPRYGTPHDIAQALHFLLTPDLYLTGHTLLFDGGLTLRRDIR